MDYFPAGSWPIVGVVSNCASPNAPYFAYQPLTGSPAPYGSQAEAQLRVSLSITAICSAAPRQYPRHHSFPHQHLTPVFAVPLLLGLLWTTFVTSPQASQHILLPSDGIAPAAPLRLTCSLHGRCDPRDDSRSFDLRVETSLTTIHPPINLLINLLHFNVPRSDPMSPSI